MEKVIWVLAALIGVLTTAAVATGHEAVREALFVTLIAHASAVGVWLAVTAAQWIEQIRS